MFPDFKHLQFLLQTEVEKPSNTDPLLSVYFRIVCAIPNEVPYSNRILGQAPCCKSESFRFATFNFENLAAYKIRIT